jgi:predicted RNase H-like HicB family nuclease
MDERRSELSGQGRNAIRKPDAATAPGGPRCPLRFYLLWRMTVYSRHLSPVADGVPTMLMEYLHAALSRAQYEILPEDQTFYGEIPECQGVYANAKTLEACRTELAEVLEEWVLFRVSRNLPLPVLDGIELAIRDVA